MLYTNAQCNRRDFGRCIDAGLTVEQIVAQWPRIWRIVKRGKEAGKVAQRYHGKTILPGGRWETTMRMAGVIEFIREHEAKADRWHLEQVHGGEPNHFRLASKH